MLFIPAITVQGVAGLVPEHNNLDRQEEAAEVEGHRHRLGVVEAAVQEEPHSNLPTPTCQIPWPEAVIGEQFVV